MNKSELYTKAIKIHDTLRTLSWGKTTLSFPAPKWTDSKEVLEKLIQNYKESIEYIHERNKKL